MKPRSLLRHLPAVLIPSAVATLALAGPASAYTTQQRVAYFDSGKYEKDLSFVAGKAKKWIRKSSKKTLPLIRACEKAGYRVGRKDPGPAPDADYRIPVKVPAKYRPKAPIVSAPDPGPPGATTSRSPESRHAWSAGKKSKPKQKKKPTRSRCASTRRLAIAMDMDETAMSSFRYGSPQPNYDAPLSPYRNMVLGSQTALEPMLKLYRYARKREMVAFVITARYDPLQADPLVGAVLGGADLCDPSLAAFGACGIDIATYDFRKVTRANLTDEGYTKLRGLYMRPPDSENRGEVKNAQRAEIVKRRGYRLVAMFGDQDSDLVGGFFERGFKYQSPE
ncbi:MAG: hypothetical protein KDB62_09885 [Solirubrobacterales bacterium]|nr:hypothetical protein [Solirubrobacterales bacterium]